jgi:hypothetical protein
MRNLVVVWLFVMGCAESPVSHGNSALGVSTFTVRSGPASLEIVGVDRAGATRVRLALRTGMVTPEEWEASTLGRELRFEIMGTAYPPFASAGVGPLELPLTADPKLNSFVLDPFVAEVLGQSGIVFADRAPVEQSEVGYAQCAMNAYYAPCNGFGTYSECHDFFGTWEGNVIWDQRVVCDDPQKTRVERRCAFAGASTPCGIAGPNGCAPCGLLGHGGWTECRAGNCRFGPIGPDAGDGQR